MQRLCFIWGDKVQTLHKYSCLKIKKGWKERGEPNDTAASCTGLSQNGICFIGARVSVRVCVYICARTWFFFFFFTLNLALPLPEEKLPNAGNRLRVHVCAWEKDLVRKPELSDVNISLMVIVKALRHYQVSRRVIWRWSNCIKQHKHALMLFQPSRKTTFIMQLEA